MRRRPVTSQSRLALVALDNGRRSPKKLLRSVAAPARAEALGAQGRRGKNLTQLADP